MFLSSVALMVVVFFRRNYSSYLAPFVIERANSLKHDYSIYRVNIAILITVAENVVNETGKSIETFARLLESTLYARKS